ncbi:hypothetical protein [Pseudoalteromonas sp. M8]|uniref:hypothetical protein n=1 Tax=Pseudoalteromonas sp. M8 TaxID=2692624 RepID=UPI001BAAB00C|nr:hypothetical protein [Pseudoalteromonas sp. M8]QUI71245.1 hypothetical protein GSF13_16470 [Pseudoalteromonas sp. M8]
MELLIKIAPGNVEGQLPDEPQYFTNQHVVTIGDATYLHCKYSGTKQIASDYDVAQLKTNNSRSLPVIGLNDIAVETTNGKLIGQIWWVPKSEKLVLTARATGLPNGGLMVMVERVVNASQPIEDLRFIATIKDGVVTLPLQFDTSGNYLITAKRLNEGLARIENAPFRLDFETMEFDVYVPVTTS